MTTERADTSPAKPRDAGRTPSIYEVARLAAVSVATVSRVLNDKGPIRPETRARVLAAVATLDYVPHSAARSLSTRRTMSIGVLLPDLHGAFFSELVRGIDLAARAAGYHLLVSGSHSDPAETAAVLQTFHGRVDGLVFMTPGLGGDWLGTALPKRVPVVLLNDEAGGQRHHSLRVDNRRGARLAVEHLLSLGHRRVAFIAGPTGNSDAADRLAGYHDGLAANGVMIDPRLELAGDFGEESGFRAGAALADLEPRPTAVFAANDAMAIGCLSALRERRVAIPEDLSIVGFDDIPIARYLTPALTSVHVPIAELGSRAMETLLRAVDGHHNGERVHQMIPTALVTRASTSPPRGMAIAGPTSSRPTLAYDRDR